MTTAIDFRSDLLAPETEARLWRSLTQPEPRSGRVIVIDAVPQAQSQRLQHVLDYRTGTCPRCGRSLSPDWTAQLLADAARADAAQRHLIGALRNLRNLPGNVALRPNVALRNLFEEVGWQKDLAEDPAMLREELRELRWLLTAWELLDPSFSAAQPRRNWFLRRLDRLTGQHLPPPVMPINDATAAPREEPATPDTPEKEEERCSPVLAS